MLAETPSLERNLSPEAAAPVNVTSADSLKRDDLQKVEVLLAQLQIKVEAMDANIQDMPTYQAEPGVATEPAPGTALKEDLTTLETMLKDVQTSVLALATRDRAEVENAVTKDDTDAIETLLRNTKAQIEELVLPDPETAVTKDNIDAVEAVVRVSNDAIESLAAKIEETTATKADVAVVEVLAQDLKTALDELKESIPQPDSEQDEAKLTKTDLDVLGIMLTEIKTRVNDMILPDVETLPTNADVEQVRGLIDDFRQSHDKFRENYEKDIAVTAKAFDDRQQDTEHIVGEITAVKEFLEAFKDDMISKVNENDAMAALEEGLKGVQEKLEEEPAMAATVGEILEMVKSDFERAHGTMEDLKTGSEENHATLLEKHGEHREAIIAALTEKIDTSFDGLMSKYDDAQQATEAKSLEQAELLSSTKEISDELKLSIDTLGTAITACTTGFSEVTDKLSEDSKIVFNRVDDTFNKLDETQEGLRAEHQSTREEVARVVDGISGLQGDFTEYHPRVMMSLKELHALVTQHYEHSQKAAETAQDLSLIHI